MFLGIPPLPCPKSCAGNLATLHAALLSSTSRPGRPPAGGDRKPPHSKRTFAMEYRKLGSTGLDVSRICLGCMTFGVPERGNHEWTLGEEESRPIIRKAVEAG